jgi:hypothetical protein
VDHAPKPAGSVSGRNSPTSFRPFSTHSAHTGESGQPWSDAASAKWITTTHSAPLESAGGVALGGFALVDAAETAGAAVALVRSGQAVHPDQRQAASWLVRNVLLRAPARHPDVSL